MHFTPTSASWLNQVERFFGLITEDRIRRGVFKSVTELEAAIQQYLEHHNADPKPFVWTASAAAILEKVARGRQALKSTTLAWPRGARFAGTARAFPDVLGRFCPFRDTGGSSPANAAAFSGSIP